MTRILGVEFSPLSVGFVLTRHSSMSAVELIHACAEFNDGKAWEEFVVRFHRPISLSILRCICRGSSASQQLIDDLVQETYLKLCADKCRQLCAFSSLHPEAVVGYIKTIALNVARDHFKVLHSQKRGSAEAAQLVEGFEAETRSGSFGDQDAMERAILLGEIDNCLGTCSEGPDLERDRLVFWLYYQQGMTAKAIAALPTVGLTPKGVESAIVRLTRVVREHVAGLRSQGSASPRSGEKGFRPAESY
jgi:RNA polymerase sigma-70 factor (ECF subfamily)